MFTLEKSYMYGRLYLFGFIRLSYKTTNHKSHDKSKCTRNSITNDSYPLIPIVSFFYQSICFSIVAFEC